MGFSSFPIFLDPPNWSQMQQQQPLQCLMSGGGGSDHHHHLIPPLSSQHHHHQQQQQLAPLPCNNNNNNTSNNTATSGPPSGSLQQQPSSVDPAAQPLAQDQAPSAQVAPSSGVTSMTERARLARVPLPEPGTLRCPRCDSANTKFCYFNNYSLSQPRHFCKACRRYWTRGGALRNVPVGGGCRRNTKRSSSKKSSRSSNSQSQSQATSSATSSCSTTTAASASTTSAAAMQALPHHLGLQLEASLEGYHGGHHGQLQFLPAFMQQQQQGMMMMQHGGHGGGYGHFADGGVGDVGSAGQQQLPDGFPRGMVASGLLAQLASIKMEEHGAIANGGAGGIVGGGGFQLGLQAAHEQYWPGSVGGGWPTEFLSGFSSSSSGNVL